MGAFRTGQFSDHPSGFRMVQPQRAQSMDYGDWIGAQLSRHHPEWWPDANQP